MNDNYAMLEVNERVSQKTIERFVQPYDFVASAPLFAPRNSYFVLEHPETNYSADYYKLRAAVEQKAGYELFFNCSEFPIS